ncbi:heparinase [Opitutaceae bacterium TAV5]|nr:heparinase [Opitutaceae bacterium TAV5]
MPKKPLAFRFVSRLLLPAALIFPIALRAKGDPAQGIPRPDPARIAEITAWLSPENPAGAPPVPVFYTPPYADRTWWNAVAARLSAGELLAAANAVEGTPPPPLPRELFDDYRVTGNRAPYEKPFSERTARLGQLVYAEGFAFNGRRLPAIERELAAILEERSWAVPAHVPAGATDAETYTRVDLAAAARAWSLATTDYLLGDKLSPATRARIRAEVRARVLDPVAGRIRAADSRGFSWMAGRNNWTAICNAGVMGSALLLSDSPAERALFIAAFERFTQPYIESFGPDGFCEEGIGYWSYGYGHYIMGSELIRMTTGRRIDLMAGEQQKRIATFDVRWKVAGSVYPAFGDASVRARTPAMLHDFATLRYGGSGGLVSPGASAGVHRHPLGAQLYVMPFRLSLPYPESGSPKAQAIAAAATRPPLRDWFPDGGALVVRSASAGTGLSAAFKGGHNGQSHNHNDLGSFIVVNGSQPVLGDPGADTYVKDTFGPKRYSSGLMNSFGHPVPRVAGKLQRTGRDARAKTVRNEFSDTRDIWEIDITSAYDVPGLDRLTRTFIFDRTGPGRLEILDRVAFRKDSAPRTFDTALILRPGQKYERNTDDGLRVYAGNSASDAALDASWKATSSRGGRLLVQEEPVYGIVPDQPPRGLRMGLGFENPVEEATIHLIITPAGGK